MPLEFLVFCTGSVPAGGEGIITHGAASKPVLCAGVVMNVSDFVCGGSNGVVVMPAGLELEVLQEAATMKRPQAKGVRDGWIV